MSLLKGEIGTQTYSQERAQCGDEGRDEALLPHVKHTRDHQQTARSQGTGREQTGSQSPQDEPPCRHPGLRAPASRTVEQEISGVDASQCVVLWYNSFRGPTHMHTHTHLGDPGLVIITFSLPVPWQGGEEGVR